MTPDQVLDAGADAIEREGWGQNKTVRSSGNHCAATAICHVSRGVPHGSDAWYCAKDALTKAIGGICLADIFTWNDAPERTKDEVTSTLRSVAAVLRAQAAQAPAVKEEAPCLVQST